MMPGSSLFSVFSVDECVINGVGEITKKVEEGVLVLGRGVGRMACQDSYRVGEVRTGCQHDVHQLSDRRLELADVGLVCEVLWLGVRDNGFGREYRFPVGDLSVLEQLWDRNEDVTGKVGLIQGDVSSTGWRVAVLGNVYPKEVVGVARW